MTEQLAAYHTMAEEIWVQTARQIDGFVQSVGTAASLRGVAEGLRDRNAQVTIVAVEPAESAVLSGGPTGAHKIDGVGAGFVVPLWHDGIADQIDQVSTEAATAMALRLGPRGRRLRGDIHWSQRRRLPATGRAART